MSFSLSSVPLRLIPGAFILNSGISKLGLPAEAAAGLQEAGSTAVPQVKNLSPEDFGKLLAGAEIGVGAALLLPFVSNRLAGLGLGAFAAAMLTMYFRTPGMTREDGVRPTQEGTAVAKDSWLAAIAASLIIKG